MGLLECSNVYWEFAGQCTQCGRCTAACTSLTAVDMTLGEIAKALLSAERGAESREELAACIAENPALVQAVRGCFFCTSCENTCFAHNDVCRLIYHARVDFQDLGLIPRDAWSSVQVDQEWSIFTAYRAIHGIDLTDLTRHVATEAHAAEGDFELAFFPGCSMAAYAPELTREIFTTVEALGGRATLIDQCCGSPLKSAGFYDRALALRNRIVGELQDSGARRVVCVCPGCMNDLRSTFAQQGLNLETVSLAAFLAERGFSPKRALPTAPLCFSKSCQDRDGEYLEETRAVLGAGPETPVVLQGCCGAGGAVSAFDPNRQTEQAARKLSAAEDGATVVTMCPTCTYTYAFSLMGNPRTVVNKHYTELLFEHQFDWERVFAQLGGMWSGEYGAWLAQVFA
jgi:Fe-S oxidoreductase